MNEEQTNSIKVLIVEDQEIMRLGLRLTLQTQSQFTIVGEAEDGPEAVEKAASLAPDVVLMDIGLKTLDGIETAKLIKSNRPSIRVLILTSHYSDDNVFAALSAGADGYCLKTTPPPQLILAIQTVNSGAAWLDPGIAGRVIAACAVRPDEKTAKREQGRFDLTGREQEVLGLIVEGLTNQQIAQRLQLSTETVKSHVSHIMEKMLVSDRTQAAVKALRHGYVS